jgi:hypothetical protein
MAEPVREQFDQVLQQVRGWPTAERLRLIEQLASTVRAELPPVPQRTGALLELRGVAAGQGPPLDDEAVDRLRYEALMEKYGR